MAARSRPPGPHSRKEGGGVTAPEMAVEEEDDDEARDWRDEFWDYIDRQYELSMGDL